ncbi:MAG: radical SAM protein [Clostridia bacterium]|nr:radical SAM protein [Clostridia bacterium]
MTNPYSPCALCPFECGVDRLGGVLGRCGCDGNMRVARIAPHYWEEPCLSGQGIESDVKGSGTVFFVGCSLGCVFCQNRRISERGSSLGKVYTESELADEFLRLEALGVHNVNLVTASHFAPSVAKAISIARARGLTIPTVYNCSGYERLETLKMLCGLIDVYMPDFKFYSSLLSTQYAKAPDYNDVCENAIREMQRQTGKPVFNADGFMTSGTLVRHLVLPGSDADSRRIISLLRENFGTDGIALSIMSQYTPQPDIPFPELAEKLSPAAYLRVVERAQELGFKYLYTQSGESADESFIPEFR